MSERKGFLYLPDQEVVVSDPGLDNAAALGWCKASFLSVESPMKVLEKVFVSIENFFSDLDARRRDAYLAQSQNVADLERRLRSLDSRPNNFW